MTYLKTHEISLNDKLALYYFIGYPFCTIATPATQRLKIDVEFRNIDGSPQYREQPINVRGRYSASITDRVYN